MRQCEFGGLRHKVAWHTFGTLGEVKHGHHQMVLASLNYVEPEISPQMARILVHVRVYFFVCLCVFVCLIFCMLV